MVSIEQQNGTRKIIEQTVIKDQSAHGAASFGQDGDSGAWIFNKCGVLIGMIWGGCSRSGSCYFTHIKDIIQDIEKATGLKVDMYREFAAP